MLPAEEVTPEAELQLPLTSDKMWSSSEETCMILCNPSQHPGGDTF